MLENTKRFQIRNVDRFPAVDSRSLTKEQISLVDPQAWKLVESKTKVYACDHVLGSIGCYLSHVFALKKFVEEMHNVDYCVIAEDDIEFDQNFEQKLNKVLNNAPSGWGLIGLGKVLPKIFGKSSIPIIRISNGITFISMPFVGATCYVVEKQFAKKIVDEAFPSKIQYDWFLSQMLCKDPNKIYYITNPIISRNEFSKKSDILKTTNIEKDPWKAPSGLDGLKDRPKSMDFQGSCCTVDYTLLWILLPSFLLVIIILIVILSLYFQANKYQVLP